MAADGTAPDAGRWKAQVTPDGGMVVASAASLQVEGAAEGAQSTRQVVVVKHKQHEAPGREKAGREEREDGALNRLVPEAGYAQEFALLREAKVTSKCGFPQALSH